WVFAGGRYWIQDKDAERIIKENGYEAVSSPRTGDLVTYWDNSIGLLHTGIVRSAGSFGLVLVESKWCKAGRYLHTVDSQPYGRQFVYYRSQRPGHLLNGLDGNDSSMPPPPKTDGPEKVPVAATSTPNRNRAAFSGDFPILVSDNEVPNSFLAMRRKPGL